MGNNAASTIVHSTDAICCPIQGTFSRTTNSLVDLTNDDVKHLFEIIGLQNFSEIVDTLTLDGPALQKISPGKLSPVLMTT